MSRQHVRLRSPADAVFLRVAAKLALRWTASPKTNGAVAGISGEVASGRGSLAHGERKRREHGVNHERMG
jgi:hypothetical protein